MHLKNTLISFIFTPAILTLLALSTSIVPIIVWPGVYPLYGIDPASVKGPDLQQRQQKLFDASFFTGS